MNPLNILLVVSELRAILAQAGAYTDAIGRANAEGRDITNEELATLRAADDAARAAGEDALAHAKSEGR